MSALGAKDENRRRRRFGLVVLLAAVAPLVGCGDRRTTLLLYCGAGIRPPVAEAVEEFQRRHGVRVECDYAGSEVLLSRIKLSGRGDLYLPGDVYYIEQATEAGLVKSNRAVCYFIPVILVQKGNPKNIRSLADLVRPDIKLGLGDPEVCAIGRKSKKIFAKNDIAEAEIEPSVKFRSTTVNELIGNVKLRALDAAIVWDGVAANVAEETDIVRIPPEQNVISTVAVGVLESSTNPELAARFVEFLASEQGREIFKKHHYSLSRPE